MKYKGLRLCLLITGLCIFSGCSEESVYTLSQDEVSIKVHDTQFDPLSFLLKDGEPLSESDRSKIKTGAKIDTSVVGKTVFTFPEYGLNLHVSIVDEEAPSLSVVGFQVKKDVVFTWNEETLGQLKAQISDNYDNGDLLKKTLHCDSVDTSKLGKQSITCYVEDSSGNKASKTIEMEVVK